MMKRSMICSTLHVNLNWQHQMKLTLSQIIDYSGIKSDVISEHEASANGRGVKVLTSALNMPLAA